MAQGDHEPLNSGSSHEEQLADLLWDYVDRFNAGDRIDHGVLREEHPEFADELLCELESLTGWTPDSRLDDNTPLGTLGDYTLRRQIGRGGMDFLPFWKKNLGAVTPSSRGVVRAFVLFARGEAFASPRVRR